ncbi:MAG: hypothetical protein MUF87_08445 [Anaerolineae bacterium]|nr:hypothetical protein [Anaerolineae bacterium]
MITNLDDLQPYHLTTQITPYLQALIDLQKILSELKGEVPPPVKIRSITQNSPIETLIEGVGQSLSIVFEQVIPWRKRHAQKMADLAEREKELEIARKQAELEAMRSQTHRDRDDHQTKQEAERIRLEQAKIDLQRQQIEVEQKQIEVEKQRFELEQDRINLAITIIDKYGANLPEAERIAHITRLLPPVTILTDTPLEIEDRRLRRD